ncbi:MAG: DUF1559 domain-containing protein [Gemmataceae bacterium]|nr:DUF1559 domain-containing protein [Gemmataceae bacterium]
MVVVLAIVSILLALTTASVQRVRAAAARTACANQLRQLALALQSYEAQRGAYPPGVAGDRDPREPYPFLAFHARLLPFLEQEPRWAEVEAAFRTTKDFMADPPHTGLSTAMPQFGCPLDARVRTPQPARGRPDQLRGLTSYLGVEGTNSLKQDGLLFLNSKVRTADVADGLSNTLALGERPASPDFLFGWWYGGWGQDKDGEADMLLGVRTNNARTWVPDCPKGPYSFTAGKLDNTCDVFHFWSLHPGGAHFAFADGSARFLRYSADDLLPALATRAGGEAVALPD